MATARQIAANKANSQKSSGPRTTEGKAKSCLNNFSHGFASNTARLVAGEDPEDLKALLVDLTVEFQPATPTEQIFVEKMALGQWQSLRAFRFQSEAFTRQGGYAINGIKITISNDLGLLIRYQSAADRAFHRAHTDLVKAQKERKKSEIGFEPQDAVQPADPPPAKPETELKTAPITCVRTDFPVEPASSAAPNAHHGMEIVPEVPDFKNASLKNAA